ncbi:hypothetical protein DEFR109230_05540 [Deinococcus frigens]
MKAPGVQTGRAGKAGQLRLHNTGQARALCPFAGVRL